jgi:hypothetical protein
MDEFTSLLFGPPSPTTTTLPSPVAPLRPPVPSFHIDRSSPEQREPNRSKQIQQTSSPAYVSALHAPTTTTSLTSPVTVLRKRGCPYALIGQASSKEN